MDAMEIGVVISGVAAIPFVLWYFFGERERTAASTDETGIQRVKITVQVKYSPDVVVEKQQAPVRLDFYRDEAAACSEQVVFGDFGIARDLIDDANWTDVCRPLQCGNELSDFGQLRV